MLFWLFDLRNAAVLFLFIGWRHKGRGGDERKGRRARLERRTAADVRWQTTTVFRMRDDRSLAMMKVDDWCESWELTGMRSGDGREEVTLTLVQYYTPFDLAVPFNNSSTCTCLHLQSTRACKCS